MKRRCLRAEALQGAHNCVSRQPGRQAGRPIGTFHRFRLSSIPHINLSVEEFRTFACRHPFPFPFPIPIPMMICVKIFLNWMVSDADGRAF